MSEQRTSGQMSAQPVTRRLSRRRFMQFMAMGVGSTAAASLLTACGDDDEAPTTPMEDTPAAATEPTPTPADDGTPDEDETPTPDDTAERPAEGGQVSVLWGKPVTLNPLFSSSGNEQQIERLMFGALVKMNNELEPVPDLAETVEVSDDATVFTFTLHDNIRFTDDEQLTADDVVFTLQRAIDPRTGSRWVGRLAVIAGAEEYGEQEADEVSGLQMIDDLTIQITLSDPNAAFLVDLCNFAGLGILPEHVLAEVPADQLQEHRFSLNPDVTAGAFQFVRYETDQFLEVVRHENYFGDPPAVDRMFLRILTPEVGLAQLETGEIDVMTLPVSEAERVRQLPDIQVESVESPSMDFIALNMSRPYLQDLRLRQAMIHAIDREGIVNQILQGEGRLVNSSIFGPEWMGTPEGLNEYPYDADQARQLLEESDWDPGQTLQIMHLPGNRTKDEAIVIIQEQWRQIGLNAEILQVDVAELNRRYIQENDFDVFYNAGGVFRADPNVSATYFLARNFTPDGGNGSHYSNPEIDDLFEQGRSTTDQDERRRIYTEIAQILNQELPWIFLWSPNSLFGVSDRLQGFVPPSYTDNKFWNAEGWSVSD